VPVGSLPGREGESLPQSLSGAFRGAANCQRTVAEQLVTLATIGSWGGGGGTARAVCDSLVSLPSSQSQGTSQGWRVSVESNVVAKAPAARRGKAHLCRHRARSCLRLHPPLLLFLLPHTPRRCSARRPQRAAHTTLDARTCSAPCACQAKRDASKIMHHAARGPVCTRTRRRGRGFGFGGRTSDRRRGQEPLLHCAPARTLARCSHAAAILRPASTRAEARRRFHTPVAPAFSPGRS